MQTHILENPDEISKGKVEWRLRGRKRRLKIVDEKNKEECWDWMGESESSEKAEEHQSQSGKHGRDFAPRPPISSCGGEGGGRGDRRLNL